MIISEFVAHLYDLDVKLWYEGDQLRINAPKEVLTPDLRADIARRKAEILVFLQATNAFKQASNLPIQSVARNQDMPLSFAQLRLWFLDQLEPGSATYNIPLAVRLTGALNIAALEQSLNEIVRRHEALRTSFIEKDGQPFQVISPTLILGLPVVDLAEFPEAGRDAEAQRLAIEEAQRPFDLGQGPLLRTSLLRLSEAEHVLLLTMHHIVSDGWSLGVFMQELRILYKGFSTGQPSPLPELPIQYADFAYWQRQWLQGEILEEMLSYWKQRLGDAPPVLSLPTDRPRPAIQTFQGAKQSLVLTGSLSEKLKNLSRQEGVTLFMTLLAAFQTLLHRYTGQDEIIVGSPIAGRNRTEFEGLIGFFINTLVLCTDLSGNPPFREILQQVREVALGAYDHQDLPFEKLVEKLQPERNLSRTPLFQVMFNMLNIGGGRIDLHGLSAELVTRPEPESKFDLTLYLSEHNEEIRLDCVYNTDLFHPDRMIEMLAQYQVLLSQIVENPDEKISRFSTVTAASKKHLPNPVQALNSEWSGAVHSRFSQQALRVPEHPAVIDGHETWTYQELDARSNQLANYLHANGIRFQDTVAIYGHRCGALVWALLSVLKAGAAFVILDPAYPVFRLIDCLKLARPQGWLTLESAGGVPDELEAFVATSSSCCRLELPNATAKAHSLLSDYSMNDPQVAVGPDDLAYVAFTSGSTGKPKGILGEHRPLSHFVQWHNQTFDFNESDRFSMLSGLSHDPLLRDIFTPLWIGAAVCIPDAEELKSPDLLAEWMKQQKISIVHLTPALGQLLTEATAATLDGSGGSGVLNSLRYAFFGGDVLTKRHVSRLRQLAPSASCVNFYGATETPQAMGYRPVSDEIDQFNPLAWVRSKQIIPVGKGIKDAQLLVLNSSQRLAGVGEVGEIHVRSPYLARGYLSDKAETQKRFVMNPFTQTKGDRLYKTGDLGRYRPDGDVEFSGRNDDQVKIRGFRVELKEIEAVLGQHSAVDEAVVLVREDAADGSSATHREASRSDSELDGQEKRLVAYVVTEQKPRPTVSELGHFLRQKLPEYMVPSTFVFLEVLPLTPNGKVNRRALPAPDGTRPELKETFVMPRNPVEEILSGIWSDLLGIEQVGIYDNFFDLGGHSLIATRLISRLREALQLEMPLRNLFEAPTIADLTELILRDPEKRVKVEKNAQLLLRLAQLSEDDVEDMLADKF